METAVADRRFQIVLDRKDVLLKVKTDGTALIGPRLRAALGDAGIPGIWRDLIRQAKEHSAFVPAEGAFVCLRGARWCSWNGQFEEAESLYRMAMKLGADADLDLDVENALWALTAPLFDSQVLCGQVQDESHGIDHRRHTLVPDGEHSDEGTHIPATSQIMNCRMRICGHNFDYWSPFVVDALWTNWRHTRFSLGSTSNPENLLTLLSMPYLVGQRNE